MRSLLRRYPGTASIVLTLVGYGLVLGTLYGDALSVLYPTISLATVNVLSHVIAGNNLLALIALGLGWYWIRSDQPRRHRVAMIVGFTLILVFLVLYLLKTGGGGRKEFLGPESVRIAYLLMLAVHILLSILSVPLVVYTLVLGISRPLNRVPATIHAKVGRWAAGSWLISLFLGLVCYVLLNHAFAYEYVPS
jgi:putative membrane protein